MSSVRRRAGMPRSTSIASLKSVSAGPTLEPRSRNEKSGNEQAHVLEKKRRSEVRGTSLASQQAPNQKRKAEPTDKIPKGQLRGPAGAIASI